MSGLFFEIGASIFAALVTGLLLAGLRASFSLSHSFRALATELRMFRESTDRRLDNHEVRIQKLEDKT